MATKKKMLQAAAGNAGGAALNVEDVFSTYLYTGNSSTQTITNDIDLDGEGGLVWIKDRDAGNGHNFYDTERGATKRLASNLTSAETTRTNGVTSFNANGFSGGNDASINTNGNDYASWTWRKAPKFFTCLTYTGNQTVRTISHNLGSVPGCIIIKNLDQSDGNATWQVYHRSLSNNASRFLRLNTTDTDFPVGSWMNDTAPTSTEFTLGTGLGMNWSGQRFVAYLFAHNDGDGEFGPDGDLDAIKCGSYTGNGSSTGPEIDLGFEPQWLLVKDATSANDWFVWDIMRGLPNKVANSTASLSANTSAAEVTQYGTGPTPTGFQIQDNNAAINTSGNTYIYMAIRRGTKVPESGSEVFAIDTQVNQDPPLFDSGFPVDFALTRNVSSTANWAVGSRLIQGKQLNTDNGSAETSNPVFAFDYMDGWNNETLSTNSSVYSWMWKRAPGYFDAVTFSGTGSARTVSHNLTVAPEMMWVKSRAEESWVVYHTGIGNAKYLVLNSTSNTIAESDIFQSTNPTASVFSLGADMSVNNSNYIAYLFASLDGISKVGSYVGTASQRTILRI